MSEHTAAQLTRKGQRIHDEEGHEGDYGRCAEWTCIAYRARARQVEARQHDGGDAGAGGGVT